MHGLLRAELVLLQGPPGTGKTTTLVQVPRATMAPLHLPHIYPKSPPHLH